MLDDFTAVIVTFNSEYIIYKTIEKLPKNLKIIVVENSNNLNFKNFGLVASSPEILQSNIYLIEIKKWTSN